MAASLAGGDASPRWYVAQIQPNREFGAERQLLAQGFRAYLPSYWKTIRHARQFRTVKAALFPGYMFVELAMGRDRWRSVNGTIGVSRMIMEGERPKPVPPGVVEDLLAVTAPDGLLVLDDGMHAGQTVRVLSGPFAGAMGTLVRMTSAERVQVLLDIMGGGLRLSMQKKALAPVGA